MVTNTSTSKEDWFTEENVADPVNLPQPCGYRVLIRPLPPIKKTVGGIILADVSITNQELVTTVGRVLKIGNLCWTKVEHMLPVEKDGETVMGYSPWCNEGDYITYGKYVGFKLEVSGVKLIIINDDEVVAKVTDPTAVRRF